MFESLIRNSTETAYHIFYPLLTSGTVQDREIAHERILNLLERYIENNEPFKKVLTRCFTYEDPILEQEIWGLKFKTPLMLAAGFDKDARVYKTLAALGMPTEVGTIPRWPYKGSERTRIFMLEGDQGMINRMGYPSDGLHKIIERLARKYTPKNKRDYNIFLNFGVNQPSFDHRTPLFDLALTYNEVYRYADVLTLAFSPNTKNSLEILEPKTLSEALRRLNNIRSIQNEYKPLLLKMPDLSFDQINKIVDIALNQNIDGFVIGNTSKDFEIKKKLTGEHKDEDGGYSGRYLTKKTSAVIRYVSKLTEGKIPLVACGGLGFSITDLWEMLAYDGASLFQVYTAFVHPKTSTPNFAYNFNKELAKMLRDHEFNKIQEAVGVYTK